MWLWLAPSHIKAILRVMLAEGPLRFIGKCFGMKPITFVVTDKATGPGAGRLGGTDGTGAKKKKKEGEKDSALDLFLRNLRATWYFLVFYALFMGTIGYTIYQVATHQLTAWMTVVYLVNLLWWGLAAWCLWPPVAALFPRVETETGWKIHWHAFLPRGKPIGPIEPLKDDQETEQGLQRKPSMAARLVKAMSTRLSTAFGSRKVSGDPTKDAEQLEKQASRAASQAVDFDSYSNIGRLAQPIRSAKSLAASALLTGAILPEREDHSFAASRQASHVLVLADGRLAPAPSGAVSSARSSFSGGRSPRQSPTSGSGSPTSLQRRASRLIAPSPFLNTQSSIKIKIVRAESLARKLEKLTGASSLSEVVILPPGADLVAQSEGEEDQEADKRDKFDFSDPSSESVTTEISLAVGDLPPSLRPSASVHKVGDTIHEEEELKEENEKPMLPEMSFMLPPKKPAPMKGVSFKLPTGHKDLGDGEDGALSSPRSSSSPTSPKRTALKKKGVSFKLAPGADKGDDDDEAIAPEISISPFPLSSPSSPSSPASPKSSALKKKAVSFRLAPGADKGDDDDEVFAPEVSIALFPRRESSVVKPQEEQLLPPPSSLPSIKTSSDVDKIADQIVAGMVQDDEDDSLLSLSPFAAKASTPFTFENTGAREELQDSIVPFPVPNAVAHPPQALINAHLIAAQRSKNVKPLQLASSRRVTSLSLAEKRARAASRYLLDWTPSITGNSGASSVLLSGGSMMVPIVPTSIFESSIGAKPSFEDRNRKKPLHSNSFLIASVAIELGMIIVGIVSSVVQHPLPT